MIRIVNVHEAKTHLSRLLEDVRGGDEIVLAKSGVPVARLVPIVKPTMRELGFVDAVIPDAFFDPLFDDELRTWEGQDSDLT